VQVVEWLDHSRKNVGKFRRRGLVGDLGAIGGDDGIPIRPLLIEEDVVLGPCAGENLEIAPRRVRRRMIADRRQIRDAVDAHVRGGPNVVKEPVIGRATAADKEHVLVCGLDVTSLPSMLVSSRWAASPGIQVVAVTSKDFSVAP